MTDNDDVPMGVSIEGLEKALEDAGKMAFAYYESLCSEGFEQADSFALTQDFMGIWWDALLQRAVGDT